MKRPSFAVHCTLIALISVAALTSGCHTSIHNPGIPLQYEVRDFADTWFGFTAEGSAYYCLILNGDGTGLVLTELWDGTVRTQPIEGWNVNGAKVSCRFRREKGTENVARLELAIRANQLIGKLTGLGGWQEEVFFRRGRVIKESLSRLGNSIPRE